MFEIILKNTAATTRLALLASVLLVMCFSHVSSSQEIGAVIQKAEGSVMINPPGKVLWEEAGAGQQLSAGTRVRTGKSSQVVISFTGGSYLMLFSVTEISVEEYEADTGAKSSIFNVLSGKVLMWMDFPKENEQFIARANNMVMNGRQAKIFIEAEGGEISCVDVVDGSTTLVSMQYPDDFVTLHANQRLEVAGGEPLTDPAVFESIPSDASLGSHSCFINAKKMLAEKKAVSSESIFEQSTTEYKAGVIIISASANVSFSEGETETSVSYYTPTYVADMETPTYHIMIVRASLNVPFTTPEELAEPQYFTPSTTTVVPDAQDTDYVIMTVKNSTTVSFSSPAEEAAVAPEQIVAGEIQFSTTEYETASVIEQEYQTLVVKKSQSITFASPDASSEADVTSVVEATPVDSTMTFSPEETTSYIATDASETGQDVEYVEIVVRKSTTVKFEPPAETTAAASATTTTTETAETAIPEETATSTAEATPETTEPEVEECTAAPVLADMLAGELSVSEEDVVSIESETICEKVATVELSWNASVECGTMKSMKIAVSGYESTLAVPENTDTMAGSFSVTLGEEPVTVLVTAGAENGKASTFAYSLEVADITEDPSPYFEGVTVNDIDVTDDAVSVTSYECVDMILDFAGKTVAKCGTIQSVAMTINGTSMRVEGKENWTASQVYNEEDTYMVEMVVKDSYGYESSEYMFDVELVSGIEPPEIAIETVAGQEITAFGDPITFYRSDLEDSELKVVGAADSGMCTVEKVEVSTDGGSSWYNAEGTTYWEYGFRPSEGTIEITARSTDEGGRVSEEMMNPVEIEYIAITDEQDLRTVFDRMMQAYRDKDSVTFMQDVYSAFSSSADSIEDYSRLEQALEDKFTEQGTIYIRHQVSSVLVSGTTGRVTFTWDCNSSSTGYSHTSIFIYTKETDGWKFQTVEDNDIFLRHTDQAAYIVNYSAANTTLVGDLHDSTTISAKVLDSAYNPVQNSTTVRFTALPVSGIIESTATPDAGNVEVEYTAGLESTIKTIIVTISAGSVSDTLNLTINPDYSTIPPPPGE